MTETGVEFRNTRESAGVSLEEASSDLNIPVIDLEQIESGAIGAFDDIYELKQMMINYSKYLGLDSDHVLNKFNEYMFDYTSKIPMDEIEKAVKEKSKEKDDEDRIYSPYTKIYPKEKSLKYIIIAAVIIVLVVLAVIWAISQITLNNSSGSIIGMFD